jgi:hypothetical protein
MSTKAQVKKPAKTPAALGPVHVGQPPVTVPAREAELPDIATQLEGAARLGHSLGAISVSSAAPSLIQPKPLIQRQTPEEEEEELQMKREPAAIQRQELPEEEEGELQTKPADGVQRQGGGEGFQLDDETAGRINRARGGGQPLDGTIRAEMSASMGYDFSGVRVHTDAEADDLSQQLQARAFTTSADIFFQRGAYDPGSSSGRELLAHELAHVVQQDSGRVRGGARGVLVRPACDAFEQDAEVLAGRTVGRWASGAVIDGTQGAAPTDGATPAQDDAHALLAPRPAGASSAFPRPPDILAPRMGGAEGIEGCAVQRVQFADMNVPAAQHVVLNMAIPHVGISAKDGAVAAFRKFLSFGRRNIAYQPGQAYRNWVSGERLAQTMNCDALHDFFLKLYGKTHPNANLANRNMAGPFAIFPPSGGFRPGCNIESNVPGHWGEVVITSYHMIAIIDGVAYDPTLGLVGDEVDDTIPLERHQGHLQYRLGDRVYRYVEVDERRQGRPVYEWIRV